MITSHLSYIRHRTDRIVTYFLKKFCLYGEHAEWKSLEKYVEMEENEIVTIHSNMKFQVFLFCY